MRALGGRRFKHFVNTVAVLTVLTVLLTAIPAGVESQSTSISSAGSTRPLVGSSTTYSQGLLKLTYSDLLSLVGGTANMNVTGFVNLIRTDFWPSQTRIVGLDIGWSEMANTSSPIPRQQWIDDFLTAADECDISVAFYLPDWGANMSAPNWWSQLEGTDPMLQTANSTGSPIAQSTALSLVLNSPLVVQQLERDLSQLLTYYGQHTSWVGLISDDITNAPTTDEMLSTSGFDRYSMSAFANSSFYLRTVNASGFYQSDGTKSSLWTAFNEPLSSTELVSGTWQSSDYLPLYNGTQNVLGIHFSVQNTTVDPQVRLYLGKTGSPTSPLSVSLVNSSNLTGDPLGSGVNASFASPDVSNAPGWTPPIQFQVTLHNNTAYWILLSTASGNQTNFYQVWYRDFHVDDSAIATKGYNGIWHPTGSAIVWVQNKTGGDSRIYPYQTMGISRNDGGTVTQQFRTTQAIDVRTVYLHVADKLYSTVNSTLEIVDDSNSAVLTSMSFSQSLFNGTYWWIPIPLPSAVHLQADHSYSLVLLPVPAGNGWQWHYVLTDPPQAGFDNNSKTQLFRLESYSIVSLNLMHIGPPGRMGPENGFPGATNSTWYAQSYQVSANSTLGLVQANVEKYCQPGTVTGALTPCATGQNPGDLVIQVRNSSATGNFPGPVVLAQETIPGAQIPWGRVWVNATGWSLTLSAGEAYWIVLKTSNGNIGGYYPWKEESAYQHLILRSSNAGATWGRPREPADMLINVRTSAQSFTVEPEIEMDASIGSAKWVAQSIEVPRPTNVSTILIFVSRSVGDNEGTIIVDVRADNGYGHPSSMILATGALTPSEDIVSWKGIWAVNLNYPITLQPGEKYWLVFRSVDTTIAGQHHAEMAVQSFAFRNASASYGGTALGAYQTADSGETWSLIGGMQTDLIFGLAYSPQASQKPTLGQLVNEITTRQLGEPFGNLTSGWQAYMASSSSRILNSLMAWLTRQNITAYVPPSEASHVSSSRNWMSFDENLPVLFADSSPSSADFNLFPVINAASSSPIVVPAVPLGDSIPIITIPQNYTRDALSGGGYLSSLPYLDRSSFFVEANAVAYFGNLSASSAQTGLLSRMRSDGISWPSPSSSSSGPWLVSFGQGVTPGARFNLFPQNKTYVLIDMATMRIAWSGTRTAQLPRNPGSSGLDSAYLAVTQGDMRVLYSNAGVSSEVVYPNQALYNFTALTGQGVWVLVNSTNAVQSVEVDGTPIAKFADAALEADTNYSAEGWSPQANGTVLLRFQSAGEDFVRLVLVPPAPENQLLNSLVYVLPFMVLAVAVSVDLAIWAKHRRTRAQTKTYSNLS